jgi:DNA invertase Pin-like site-specific DNA recombinase
MVPWCRANDRRLVKLIFDIDKSGQTFEGRIESVSELLEGCSLGLWQTVAVWKWSRWSRDTAESLAWLKHVEAAGGEVRACTEDVDPKQAKAKLIRGFHLLLAEDRGDEISEGWRAAHRNRRKKGLPHSGRPRFGYDYRPITQQDLADWPKHFEEKRDLGNKRYVPSSELTPVLVAAYREYNTGASLRSITKNWNERGLRTTLGKRWTPQSLGKMLDTGFSAGLIRYRTNPPKKAPANRLASYDGWANGGHPALIEEKEWRDYKARRQAQADLPPRLRAAVHSVSGMLFCGLCGNRMSTKYQGQNNTHQWVCHGRASKHPTTHIGVSNQMILDFILAWCIDQEPKDYKQRVREEAERLARQEKAKIDIAKIQNEIDKVEKEAIPKLIRLHIRGAISETEFDNMKLEQETTARNLRIELKVAKALQAESSGELDLVIRGLASDWAIFRQDPVGHRELLQTVIAGIVIFPGRGKLELPSRVKVWPAWEAEEFESKIREVRTAAST